MKIDCVRVPFPLSLPRTLPLPISNFPSSFSGPLSLCVSENNFRTIKTVLSSINRKRGGHPNWRERVGEREI